MTADFDSVEDCLTALRRGEIVLVTDDVDLPAYATCGDIEKDITEILIRTKAELRMIN